MIYIINHVFRIGTDFQLPFAKTRKQNYDTRKLKIFSEYEFVIKLSFPRGFVRYPNTDDFYTDFDTLIM